MTMRKYVLVFLTALAACDMRDNEIEPGVSFTRIYDNHQFERAYHPVDIKPTSDSGYVILGSANADDSEFWNVYLLKIDRQGNVQWEYESDNFVCPASGLIASGSDWQFFCMDKNSLSTYLVRVDTVPQVIQSLGITYPLAAAAVPGGYLVQSYERENRTTRLSRLTSSGNIAWTKEYDIYEDVEDAVIYHLTRKRKPLPFFTGATADGRLFFNGFNNFTLALTFVNTGNGDQTGVVNGTRYESAVSSAQSVAVNTFAVARYKENGENVYAPQVSLSASTTQSAGDLRGNELPELTKNARVLIQSAILNGRNVLLYASDTKNGQISLFIYEETTGALLGTKYVGSGNAFELGGLTLTPDGGLAIAGRTYVAGRFPRICVFKLSAREVTDLVGRETENR